MGRRKDEGIPFEDSMAIRSTEMALLVRLGEEYDSKEIWVPKSVIHDDSEIMDVGDEGSLVLATWFVEKEGLL
jgi:hypothetical protein